MKIATLGAVLFSTLALAGEPRVIDLSVGGETMLDLKGVTQVAIESSIVEVRESGFASSRTEKPKAEPATQVRPNGTNRQLVIHGVTAGETNLMVFKKTGTKTEYLVRVHAISSVPTQ
jgi:hypothetical protein